MGIKAKTLALLSRKKDAVVVEVGVAQGETALKLAALPSLRQYIGVDPWVPYNEPPSADYDEGYLDRKMGLWRTHQDWEDARSRAAARLRPFGSKARLIRAFSHEAAARITDELDAVYIDANHQYQYVLNDLELWYPKLKEGGVLIGDDYSFGGGEVIDGRWGGIESCGVKDAVTEFCRRNDLNHYLVDDNYVIHKPYSELMRYKDIHKNERVFLIGNGPSLNLMNLSLLKNEYTFGVNAIYLNAEKMGFYPTYYVVEDTFVAEDRACEIDTYSHGTKFIGNYLRYCLAGSQNTVWTNVYFRYDNYLGFPRFSKNASRMVFTGGTVTYICMQLAYFMGFSEVYLIGFDHSYKIPTDAKIEGQKITSVSSDPNHFNKQYFGRGKRWHHPRLDRMETAYKKARLVFENSDRIIENASIGGRLEVFSRVSFDQLF